jgi:hypothetical protein
VDVTRAVSRVELIEMFEAFFDAQHCQLFGKAMSLVDQDDARVAAEWYSDIVARVFSGDFGD